MARQTKGRLYKRGKTWWVEYYVNGKRFQESLQTTDKAEAERRRGVKVAPFVAGNKETKFRAVVHELKDSTEERETAVEASRDKLMLAEAWEVFKTDPDGPQCAETTLADYRCQWKRFVDWMKDSFPEAEIMEDVTRDHAKAFAKHLGEVGISPNRYNKYLATLRMVFRTLAGRCNDMPNPFQSVRNKRSQAQGHRELSEAELTTICQEADGELRLLLAVGLYTALRLGDACTLRWEEAKLDLNQVVRVASKTRSRTNKTLVIPLHPVLRAILEETPAEKRQGFVLPEIAAKYDGGSTTGTSRVCAMLQEHFKICGIETQEERKNGQRAVCRVGFHSLRHSFVTICARAGVPMPVVQELCGHASSAIQQVYTHMGPEATAKAIAALPGIAEIPDTSADREDLLSKVQKRLKDATVPQLQTVLQVLQRAV